MSSGRSRCVIDILLGDAPSASCDSDRGRPKGAPVALGHGIGGARDLPIPAEYAYAGAAAALAVSFIVLALAWRTPRFDAAHHGRPVPAALATLVDSRGFAVVLRVLGFAFFAYVLWAAVAGPDLLTNPTFGVVYVLLWVGIVPMSLLFGPFYRAVNPVRTLHLLFTTLTGGGAARGALRLADRGGPWAAGVGAPALVRVGVGSPTPACPTPGRPWVARASPGPPRRAGRC